ncbi:hypothetical protein J8L73_10805 [Pseudoalteromonas sp. MMG006]|uniref:hypothetical protein n=1 Tax=Pseudoalteromonas sp. MMG006 TaxID=2822683 RepID=UPI001B3931AE|nr:hypothetical protein [Pseudoalteromonas sp. MMG006]MBQ4799610.1 hypothetical protein [Pseudoalteromonas sp. MMG006]
MAFLYSLVSSINSRSKAFVILSSIMAISYFPGVLFNYQTITNLDLAILDAITIVFLIIAQYFYIKEKTVAFMYLMLGLSINICFALIMSFDSYILENYTYWWLGGLYSSVVTISGLIMILVLFINKDFLKIIYFKNFIRLLCADELH